MSGVISFRVLNFLNSRDVLKIIIKASTLNHEEREAVYSYRSIFEIHRVVNDKLSNLKASAN